jgi:hypothetical protein
LRIRAKKYAMRRNFLPASFRPRRRRGGAISSSSNSNRCRMRSAISTISGCMRV